MTAKEKANELVEKFYQQTTNRLWKKVAIQCAIIHVKVIINELKEASSEYNFDLSAYIEQWQEVLQELNQM